MHRRQCRGYCKKYQFLPTWQRGAWLLRRGLTGTGGGQLHTGALEAYRVGVPSAGQWNEVLNSDSSIYAGSHYGNSGEAMAEETSSHGQALSLVLNLPPEGGKEG
jgi:hypothetical protein